MFAPARLALLLTSVLFFCPEARAQLTQQTVFDAGAPTTYGAVSGEDDCGLDPQHCRDYRWSLSARAGELHQHFSTLLFGFASGEPCAFQAPPPYPEPRVHTRQRNECPSGQTPQYERLDTAALPGPDYGLKRVRICTASDGTLAGVETRFFKLPNLGPNGPGQEVVTRRFERNDCADWQTWSACPVGTAASGLTLYKQSVSAGGIEGVRLSCQRVSLHNPSGR